MLQALYRCARYGNDTEALHRAAQGLRDASTGVLSIYNGTGSNILVPMLLVRGTGKTGKRP